MQDKAFIEKQLNVAIVSQERLVLGRSSENWKMTTADGEMFLLKRMKRSHVDNMVRQVEVASAVGSPWAPALFHGARSWSTDKELVLAQEWKKGQVVHFENLTPLQATNFARAYRLFSVCLQRYHGPVAPTRLPQVPDVRQVVVHGDLNDANVLFDGEEVSAFLDYEMVRLGLPTEDLVRGFIHRAKRLSPMAFRKQRRLVDNFILVACASGYSKEDWQLAVESYAQRKKAQRRKRHGWFVNWLESLVRDPTYRRFERAAETFAADLH